MKQQQTHSERTDSAELQVRGGPDLLPGIKVKPPASTTLSGVFSTVPLVEEEEGICQEGVLVCTCMDTEDVDMEDEEEEEGVGCVVPGRLDAAKPGLITSCKDKQTEDRSKDQNHPKLYLQISHKD